MNNEIKVVYGDVKREAVLIDPSIPVALSGSNEGTENNQSNIIAEGTSTRELLNKNMADNHDRVIPLDDALLLTMVGEKAELVEKGLGISKQFEEMQAQLERLHMDLTAVTADVTTKKLAILKRVEELAKDKLTEFESIPPAETVLFGDRLPRKHVALRLALRSVDAGRGSGRG
jgi:NAD(P)H-flavin reductase